MSRSSCAQPTPGPRWIKFLLDGQTLATNGTDKKLIFWNAKTGKAIRTLAGHLHVAFSPDEKIIASRPDYKSKAIRILEVAAGTEIGRILHKEVDKTALDYGFSTDGRFLFVGGGTPYNRENDPPLALWEAATRKKITGFPLRKVLVGIYLSANGTGLGTSTDEEPRK